MKANLLAVSLMTAVFLASFLWVCPELLAHMHLRSLSGPEYAAAACIVVVLVRGARVEG